MKKVLVTGAAGCLGKLVLKYLLSEGKYEVTAVDLKNKKAHKVLRRYKRRVNVIYGDITDPILMDALVKEHDYIIHLATVKPTLSILNKKICREIDYKGSENIIRAITFYNPKCFLIYPSTTVVYGKKEKPVSVKDKVDIKELDEYSKTKYEIENLIKEKLNNYVIYRIPTVLADVDEDFLYNTPLNNETEFISADDTAYALVKTINQSEQVNKKIYNLGGGKNCRTTFRKLLIRILETKGLSFQYLWSLFFLEKCFYGHVYLDSEKIENLLQYQNDSIDSHFMKMKRKLKGQRKLNKILAKPFISILKKRDY